MTRIRFIRGTALGGVGNDANPGDERELPEPQARQFIAAGRAVAVATPASEPPAAQPTAEPQPTRTRKGK